MGTCLYPQNTFKMAAERLSSFVSQLTPGQKPLDKITQKNPDDIVITLAIRTPLCKAKKGGFKDLPLDGMVFKILEQVVKKSNLDPQMVEDICLGNVSDAKAAYYVRAACLAAGFPNTTAASSVNRFCSSGLKATQDIANQIMTGSIDIGVAVGAESMSTGGDRLERPFVDEIMNSNSQDAKDCTLNKDEGVRPGTTYESLSKIRPAFTQFGGDKSTGGNSSQVTDGAAAVMLMKRSKAMELGQPIVAKYVGATVAGLAPRIMGIGPSIAIPKLLGKYGLNISDIDVIELNEAFASMAVYCRDTLKLDWTKMNPRGGAIALGHPLGCTGARQIVTGLSECRRQKAKILLTSTCIGTGQGMAGLFVNEQID